VRFTLHGLLFLLAGCSGTTTPAVEPSGPVPGAPLVVGPHDFSTGLVSRRCCVAASTSIQPGRRCTRIWSWSRSSAAKKAAAYRRAVSRPWSRYR